MGDSRIKGKVLAAVIWALQPVAAPRKHIAHVEQLASLPFPSEKESDWYVYNALLWLLVVHDLGQMSNLTLKSVLEGKVTVESLRDEVLLHLDILEEVYQRWEDTYVTRAQFYARIRV